MSKKPNPFGSILAEPAPAPVVPLPAAGAASPDPARKRPGQPPTPTAAKTAIQTTTVRLDAEDHLAVRQLALRDGQTMNGLIFAALKAYCQSRGVRLSGGSDITKP